MAATYIATATAVTWSTAIKVLFSMFNGVGSGKIIKIRRIWVLNAQTAAVTGILETYTISRITTDSSGGTPATITPVKYDTASAAVPAQIVCRSGNTTNGTATTLRTLSFSGDEPAVGSFTWDEFECLIPLNCVWEVGYGNTSMQPLTLREGQGLSIHQAAIASSVGNIDINVEFTLENP